MDTKELETLNTLHYSPVDVNGGLSGPLFPVVHDQLLCLAHIDGEVVVLAPHCQISAPLPIGCLIDQAYQFCVVSKLNDGGEVVFGHTVVGEQGVIMASKPSSCLLDPIPTNLLKELLPMLGPPMLNIINGSLSTGCVPNSLKWQ